MPGDREIGGSVSGGVAGVGGATVVGHQTPGETFEHGAAAGGVQLWYARRAGNVDLGLAVGAAGALQVGGGFHGGVMVRPRRYESDTAIVAWELQLGWAYATLGLPMSFRVGDRAWIYLSPSVGIRPGSAVHLPVGLSLDLGERARLTAEVNTYVGRSIFRQIGYDGTCVIGSAGVGRSF